MKVIKFLIKHIKSVVVVVMIVVIGLVVNYVHSVSDVAIIESAFDEMEQIGLQYQISLANKLEEAEEDLSFLAELIVENNINNENIVEYMKAYSPAAEFDNLYYIEPSGNGISKNNDFYNFSENLSFLSAFENKIYVEPPHISLESSEVVFDLAIPVQRNSEIIAVLFCEVSVDDFFETVTTNKKYEGDIFFVDDNLNMIFSTSDNHIGATSIPREDVAEMGMDNVAEARSDILSKQNGGFYYDYFGTPKVMVYYPIELTNVALAMNVHVDSLSSEIIEATNIFIAVGSAIYWFLIVLVIYIATINYRSNKHILKNAYYDELTDLPNKAKFKIEIQDALSKAKNTEYTILVFDIDNFKAINEIFGYEIGDKVLKTMKTFADTVTEPSFLAARVGDDKFAMFAKSTYIDDINALVENVTAIYDEVLPEMVDYAATYKMGRYKIDKGETDVEEIISKANLAHSKAKSTKGMYVCDYNDMFKKVLQTEAAITNKMNIALENKEFHAYLQPKFNIYENKLIGAEALVRWIEADGKMIFPNDFIPLFERNGFIAKIDRYILEQVCITIRQWIDIGLSVVPISVNCSRINLQNANFVSEVVTTVDKYNVPHEYIEIELTESTTIESEQTIEQLFEDLHKEGFKISIDDFGAGQSSLAMLMNLKVDTLKMDRSFFVGGNNERRENMLIDSIVKMAHNLKMYVVAEGIETAEQIKLLRTMNCDAVQGYVYDKPMSIIEFQEKYKQEMNRDNLLNNAEKSLIRNINDTKFVSGFVSCGLLVVELDDYFTIVEANDYYFEMIGYTREEMLDKFKNRGLNNMNDESRKEFLEYFYHDVQSNKDKTVEFVNKFTLQNGEEHVFMLSGKIAIDESGQSMLYLSVSDITEHVKVGDNLQSEKDFNTHIAAVTNNAFFEYDREADTIRFSMNFAERFNIPNIINNLSTSQEIQDFISQQNKSIGSEIFIDKGEGEFCATLPSGQLTWYMYSYKTIFDGAKQKEIVVGRMMEATGHKAEFDILKMKLESDSVTDIFNKQATNRYIHNYLRVATTDIDKGTLMLVRLENFGLLESVFGETFISSALKDIGTTLRSMFRSSDIIGRCNENEFYIFINNVDNADFIEKKKVELCQELSTNYKENGISVQIIAKIGISLYPEHGDSFGSLYKKASETL